MNGIPIASFVGQKDDEELLFMVTLLEEIYALEDVRPALEDRFGMIKMMQEFGQMKRGKESKELLKDAMESQQQNNYNEQVKKGKK